MRTPLLALLVVIGGAAGLGYGLRDHRTGSGGGGSALVSGPAANWADVRALLSGKCAGCHPGVVSSLNLSGDAAYASIVGVRSIEDPALPYVIAGDPERSFLFLKIAGWPGNHGSPAIGSRMPLGQGRLAAAQVDLIARWITQGARNGAGKTVSANEVPSPGSVEALAAADAPQLVQGDAVIEGTVTDSKHRPLPGAIVSMLVIRKDLPGGEEHYRFGTADARGHYRITKAPIGRIAVKAYAPGTVYVTRYLTTHEGGVTRADVGLPTEVPGNPKVTRARVVRVGGKLRIAMSVSGSGLDRNYTLAVNSQSGDAVELRARGGADEAPGRWSAEVPAAGHGGSWTFFAVTHLCTVSNFLTASPS
jgi:Carboxypeptidase regulatory-like domain